MITRVSHPVQVVVLLLWIANIHTVVTDVVYPVAVAVRAVTDLCVDRDARRQELVITAMMIEFLLASMTCSSYQRTHPHLPFTRSMPSQRSATSASCKLCFAINV